MRQKFLNLFFETAYSFCLQELFWKEKELTSIGISSDEALALGAAVLVEEVVVVGVLERAPRESAASGRHPRAVRALLERARVVVAVIAPHRVCT